MAAFDGGSSGIHLHYCERPSSLVLLAKVLFLWKLQETLGAYFFSHSERDT